MTVRNVTVNTSYSCGVMDNWRPIGHVLGMENLKRIREMRGMTQADLAEATGLTQGAISKIESGRMNVTREKINLLAAALGCEPVELFSLPDLQQRVLAAISALDPERREAALTVLESMAATPPKPR